MIEETLLYHSITVKIFLALLFINLFVPIFTRAERSREIKWTRMTFFVYSAFLVMMAFSGMISYMLLEMPWNLLMTIMVIVFVLLAAIEIARSRALHDVWMMSESGVSLSWKYVLVEIVVVAAMVVMMIMEKKGAISLS